MDTDSFIIYIKSENVYEDIADSVHKRFDTSNYEVNRPLLTRKNKKLLRLIKDKLGGNIMTAFVARRPKTYFNLMDDDNHDKK